MSDLGEKRRNLALKYGVTMTAIEALEAAIRAGRGKQARWNIDELGGVGHWQPGMTEISIPDPEMRKRINALASELAKAIAEESIDKAADELGGVMDKIMSKVENPFTEQRIEQLIAEHDDLPDWWPAPLGDKPFLRGIVGGARYAYFPGANRLAIRRGDTVILYDTTGHLISGFHARSEGETIRILMQTRKGEVDLESLRPVV